ncbi:MAG: hypothetical protein JJV97_00210 [SAR324 cluster bacterium]|nr:hypothetical protein [SAR324 cluster bacterium]
MFKDKYQEKDLIETQIMLTQALKKSRLENLKVISADMRLDYQVLVNKLNFANDCLNVKQLLHYLTHPGVAPEAFIKTFAACFDFAAIKLGHSENSNVAELHQTMTKVIKEVGDVANELTKSTLDNFITSKEVIDFGQEINEAINVLIELRTAFTERKHEIIPSTQG